MSSSPPRRLKKRFLFPGILLAVLLGLLGWAVVRGTWVDDLPRDPTTAADGVVTQLYRTENGKVVRCAAVFDAPLEAVWAVLTEYDRFSDVFPRVASSRGTRTPDGRWFLEGAVDAGFLGQWPFAARIAHAETADRCSSSWDEPSHDLLINRGSWTVSRIGGNRTLVVYVLEVDVKGYPVFIVRNVLLSKLPEIVRAAGAAVQ